MNINKFVLKATFIFFIIISPFKIYSQNTADVSLNYSSGIDFSNNRTILGGIQYDRYIGDNFQLNYSLRFGYSDEFGFTMQSTLGALGGGIVFVGSFADGSDWQGLAILSCIVPEGITYFHDIDNVSTISAYVNLLSIEYTNDYISSFYNFGLGYKRYVFDYFFISAQTGLKSLYRTFNPTIYAGINAGVTF